MTSRYGLGESEDLFRSTIDCAGRLRGADRGARRLRGEPAEFEVSWFEEDALAGSFEVRAVKLGDGIVATLRDVTARVQAEHRLRASEERRGALPAQGRLDGVGAGHQCGAA